MKKVYPILLFILFGLSSFAQTNDSRVSLIGDNEDEYERIIAECPSLLLQVTNNSMDQAYKLWTTMLSTLETSASNEGIDLKGAKIWINVFWQADGSIKKIVYYPKPNSKNMNFELVTQFFETFSSSYQLPLDHTECFSHYGSASFPVHTKLAVNNDK